MKIYTIQDNKLKSNTPKTVKKWNVNVKIFGIPEDEYEQFLTDLEELVMDKRLVLTIDLGEESEEDC